VSRTRWIIVALSFAAIFAVSGWVVWSAFGKHGTPPPVPVWAHAVALGFALLEIVSRTIKIQWGAKALAIPLPFSLSLRTCLGGDFASCLTPSRSGAEPARFLVLAEAKMPVPSILLVLFLEVVMELVTLIVVALSLWAIFGGSTTVLGFLTTIIVGYAAFLLAIATAGLLLAQRSASGPPPKWVRSVGLNAGHWRGIQRTIRHTRQSIAALKGANLPWLGAAFGASVIHVLSRLAILPVVVWSVERGSDLAPLVLWPLVLIYGGSIAPAPGGGGAVEFGFKAAFEGILTAPVLASSMIWWRFYTFYIYIILGAFAGGATVLRALRPDAQRPGQHKRPELQPPSPPGGTEG
jgi:uncharacterized protein (TIRG00374 family)